MIPDNDLNLDFEGYDLYETDKGIRFNQVTYRDPETLKVSVYHHVTRFNQPKNHCHSLLQTLDD